MAVRILHGKVFSLEIKSVGKVVNMVDYNPINLYETFKYEIYIWIQILNMYLTNIKFIL